MIQSYHTFVHPVWGILITNSLFDGKRCSGMHVRAFAIILRFISDSFESNTTYLHNRYIASNQQNFMSPFSQQ